jgi:hypothetical protein
MASPFPGMDPYLERFWGDIHHRLITYACDQLQGGIPGDLRARVEERVFVESPIGEGRSMYPDIRVVERGRGKGQVQATASGVAVAEPFRIRLPDEPITQGYIEIIDLATGRRVVTVVEVLSPANKVPGPGFTLYQRKQRECKEGGVNLVEIDLLRAGGWVLSAPEHLVPASHRTTYRVCVYRAGADWDGEMYRAPLRERLPVIKIPLRPTDEDVPLDLQALIEQCYRNGGYDQDIDYQKEPEPPLAPDDARWADALLREQGRRAGRAPKRPARGGRRRRKPK